MQQQVDETCPMITENNIIWVKTPIK